MPRILYDYLLDQFTYINLIQDFISLFRLQNENKKAYVEEGMKREEKRGEEREEKTTEQNRT